jgi:hypothetical protein
VKGMLSMTPPIVPPTHTSSEIATERRTLPAHEDTRFELVTNRSTGCGVGGKQRGW